MDIIGTHFIFSNRRKAEHLKNIVTKFPRKNQEEGDEGDEEGNTEEQEEEDSDDEQKEESNEARQSGDSDDAGFRIMVTSPSSSNSFHN